MAKTNITIEKFAERINEGFKTTATKEDINEVRSEVASLRTEMKAGFERVENLLQKQTPLIRTRNEITFPSYEAFGVTV